MQCGTSVYKVNFLTRICTELNRHREGIEFIILPVQRIVGRKWRIYADLAMAVLSIEGLVHPISYASLTLLNFNLNL